VKVVRKRVLLATIALKEILRSPNMEILPCSRSTIAWEDVNTQLVTKVYTGELTMEEACKQMAAQMNEKLAEEHK